MLAYDCSGNGLPVLLLHALPFDRTTWKAVVPAVSAEARVVACDLRGHGASPREGPFDLETHARDVRLLLDDLGMSSAVIVGHSLGAYVAFELARFAPERVGAFVLIAADPAADAPAVAAARCELAAAIENGLPTTTPALIEAFFAPATIRERPDLVDAQRAIFASVEPGAIAAMLRSVAARPDARETIARTGVPVVALLGECDSMLNNAAAIEALGENATVVGGVGHMVPLEAPDQTARAIIGSVRSLDPP